MSYGIGREYLPIWVSVSVLGLNQNSGFGRTLFSWSNYRFWYYKFEFSWIRENWRFVVSELFVESSEKDIHRYFVISSYNNFSSLSAEDEVLYFLINGLLKASKIAENFLNNVHADAKISINQKVSRFQVCFSNS